MMQISAGQLLGRYELLVPVAKGGMAHVWVARLRGTHGFNKLFAVKTVLPRSLDDRKMQQMFLEEASLASQIHHPNVVETFELGEQDGILYLVMEWVEGEPLSEVIARARQHGGLPLGVAVNLIGQALKGLNAAHGARDEYGSLLGLVHRDISPQNVLVTYAGMAKLVDFGIAKATSRASDLTDFGEIKGKFAYMSPEQLCGEPICPRTDVFAMGILLYLVTTGRHPFKSDTPAETVTRICEGTFTLPSQLVRGYPEELERVVGKALATSVNDRFSTARDMLVALEHALPQAFDLNAEVRITEYVGGLLSEKAAQRRATLRLAREFLERLRSESTSTGSTGSSSISSLRGISIEQPPSSSPQPSSYREPALTSARLERTSVSPSLPKHEPQLRWPILLGAFTALTLAAAAVLQLTGVPLAEPNTASTPAVQPPEASEPVTNATPLASLAEPGVAAAAPEVTADANHPGDVAGSTAPAREVANGASPHRKHAPRHTLTAARTASDAAASASAIATATAPTPTESAASAPGTTSAPSANPSAAWDPGNFGGRQ